MDWKTLFLTAQGRIGQRDFWLGFLVLFVAGFVLGLIPVLGTIIALLLIYPNICLYSKRLHDFGKSGWLVGAFYAVSAVLVVLMLVTGGAAILGAGMAGGDDAAGMAAMGGMAMVGLFGLLAFVVGLGFLLWVGLSKGDPAENQYGPPPEKLVTAI